MNIKAIDLFIGEKLQARRKVIGLTQRGLAVKMRLSHQQIQKYERGENRVGASILYELAHILGVEVSYFFEDYEKSIMAKGKLKKKPNHFFKYKDLNISVIEDLVSAYAVLPAQAQKNILTLIKNLSNQSK